MNSIATYHTYNQLVNILVFETILKDNLYSGKLEDTSVTPDSALVTLFRPFSILQNNLHKIFHGLLRTIFHGLF